MAKRLLSILVLSVLMVSALAGCGCSSSLTILSIAEGNVYVMKAGTDSWTKAQEGMSLEAGDRIKTDDDSSAEITFSEGSTVELEAGTEVEIASLDISAGTAPATIILEQTIGSIIFRVTKIVDPASRHEIETPAGTVAVRGSAMQVYVIEDGTTWAINLEGDIWAIAQGVELQLAEGQQCIITPGQPPELIFMISAGGHTVGLKSDGTVLAVGWNSDGQCDVGDWTDVIQVAAGGFYTVGVRADGTVVAVGRNTSGQCDVSGWTDIIQVGACGLGTVGLKSDGTVVAAGSNISGEGDVGDWTDIIQVDAGWQHTVGLKSDGTVVAVGYNWNGECNVGSWTDIMQIDATFYHTVGLRTDGTVVEVGSGSRGEGDVGDWTDIVQVAAGWRHTVGRRSDGTVVAVGDNDDGQCNVDGWTDIVQIAAGARHTVGLKSDGTVVAVGYNDDGRCDVSGWHLN